MPQGGGGGGRLGIFKSAVSHIPLMFSLNIQYSVNF